MYNHMQYPETCILKGASECKWKLSVFWKEHQSVNRSSLFWASTTLTARLSHCTLRRLWWLWQSQALEANLAFQTLLATLQDCPMMQRNYEDIHPITKQINQQTFINPYKNISHKSVTIQTTRRGRAIKWYLLAFHLTIDQAPNWPVTSLIRRVSKHKNL